MAVYASVLDAVGRTPIVRLTRFDQKHNLFAKVEGMNPGGSVKDRTALYMIKDAVARGALKKGGAVVEPTSGNTGVGLAQAAAVYGFSLTLVMPSGLSVERERLFTAYGAALVKTPAELGMKGAISEAERIAVLTGAFMPSQFENPANPLAHERTTAVEIYEDMEGDVGAVVCGVGTGGTLTGIARKLKKLDKNIRIIAVEPALSPVLSGGVAGAHGLQGIGAGFVPQVLDVKQIDKIVTVSEGDAARTARELARKEGILCGISSGAALFAALGEGIARTVVILPDSGSRYLSTDLFSD